MNWTKKYRHWLATKTLESFDDGRIIHLWNYNTLMGLSDINLRNMYYYATQQWILYAQKDPSSFLYVGDY